MSFKWMRLGNDKLKQIIITAIQANGSMRAAAASIPMNFQTFRKHAQRFEIWIVNQAGKGLQRRTQYNVLPLNEILAGQHRSYGRGALKRRLLKAGIKKNECECCKISTWIEKPITMHLDHINGDPWDHRIENLRMLCPNCHSQTLTYCGRNAKVVKRQTHSV